jgi:hypothetical protein
MLPGSVHPTLTEPGSYFPRVVIQGGIDMETDARDLGAVYDGPAGSLHLFAVRHGGTITLATGFADGGGLGVFSQGVHLDQVTAVKVARALLDMAKS